MNNIFKGFISLFFLLPITSALADFEDTRRERDEKIIQKNHNDPSLKPVDTSKVPSGSVPGNPSEVPLTSRNVDTKPNKSAVNNPNGSDQRQ